MQKLEAHTYAKPIAMVRKIIDKWETATLNYGVGKALLYKKII
jgi:hypothetical protein